MCFLTVPRRVPSVPAMSYTHTLALKPLLAAVLWSQKDRHLALPRRLNGHVCLAILGISMAQHRSWVSKSQRESFLALLFNPGVSVMVTRPECTAHPA